MKINETCSSSGREFLPHPFLHPKGKTKKFNILFGFRAQAYTVSKLFNFLSLAQHISQVGLTHYIVVTAPSTLTYSTQPFHVKYEPLDPKVNGCDFSHTTLVLFGKVSGQPIKRVASLLPKTRLLHTKSLSLSISA